MKERVNYPCLPGFRPCQRPRVSPSTVSPVKAAAAAPSTPTWRPLSLAVSSRSLSGILAWRKLCPPALPASGSNRHLGGEAASLPLSSEKEMLLQRHCTLESPRESFQNLPVPRRHTQRSGSLALAWGPTTSIFPNLPSCSYCAAGAEKHGSKTTGCSFSRGGCSRLRSSDMMRVGRTIENAELSKADI